MTLHFSQETVRRQTTQDNCLPHAVLFLLVAIFSTLSSGLNSGRVDAQEVDFAARIRPLFHERCFACHGTLKQEASLRVDSVGFLKRGGDSGDVIDLKNVENSELLIRVTEEDESLRMPPEGKPLTATEVEWIRKWISQGAKAPKNDVAEEAPDQHWAFQVPKKTKVSAAGSKSSFINPIDQLLEKRRKREGVVATNKLASKSLLLRRVYLDLIGVPPTLKEMEAFEADTSPNAYEKVVEDLLSRPQHGERWGRHWMDVWRYTDWYGLGAQLRNSQKHIWHWRDWIVDSLNQDSGYDQMILEMLAADELYPTNANKLRATGFLARNYYLFNRTTWLDSTIEHTGKAFLGLTLNCAKCHDHKYDPFPQLDYYRMRAIFEPHQIRLDPVPGTVDLEVDGIPRAFDAHPDAKTFVHIRGNEKEPDESMKIQPGVPGFFGYQGFRPQAVSLPLEAYRPSLQPFALRDRIAAIEKEIDQATTALQAARDQLEKIKATKKKEPASLVAYGAFDLQKVGKENAFVEDDFSQLDKKKWRIVNGTWKVNEGKLTQNDTGPTSRIVESVGNHPADFLLEAKASVTGGQMWKSFGIRFDADAKHDKTVYLSAYKASKVQVSYSNNGQTVYPTNALANIPVKENQTYTLRVAVKGKNINVSVDGKHLVSYLYPVERRTGKLQLMSFDSVASFDSIKLIRLPKEVSLFGAGKGQPMSLAAGKYAVDLAAAKLSVANQKKTAFETGFQADRAKDSNQKNVTELVREAAIAKIGFDRATKQAALIENEKKIEAVGAKEKQKLMKTVSDLKKQIAAFDEKLKNPGTQYQTFRVSRKALEGPDEKPASRDQPYPESSTGRRTAFARWVVDKTNPLTARVAVNQIWMRHFGNPLVDSVTDFGRRAKVPVQQELLDWLAVDLMENGWKMKRLHSLIVTSQAYRMANTDSEVQVAKENRYYQLRSPIRMESQVIRDSLLHLSNDLEEQLGGPPIDPAKLAMSKRRSLYFRQSRDHKHKFVSMFDDADILRCYRRQESIIPQQALTLSNSKITHEAAKRITEILSKNAKSSDEFIQRAFKLIIGREPNAKELKVCREALVELEDLNAKRSDRETRSRITVVMGIINSNDFVTIR